MTPGWGMQIGGRRIFVGLCAALILLVFGGVQVWAQGQPALTLNVSQGKLLTLRGGAASVFIADPSIADVQVPLPTRVFIFGKKAGHTTLYALNKAGKQLLSMEIDVENDTLAPTRVIERNPAAGDIHVLGSDNGLALEGKAIDPEAASDASRSATNALGDKQQLDDHIKVQSSAQVTLRVRIAEVSRTVSKDLGFNFTGGFAPGAAGLAYYMGRQIYQDPTSASSPVLSASNGDYSLFGRFKTGRVNITAVIDALATEGLISVLAEPTLTALSGQPASFLAGGEFPIPIVQSGGNGNTPVTIVFKQYGVSLEFIPTVMSSNHISLHVRPEVSQLTESGAITLNGITVPALQVRRADTTIELGSGESFAIGGLLQNNTTSTINRYPGLGDLPILGALFRSSNFQRNESELLIIVTPYIVKPIDDPKLIKMPTDGLKPSTDLERIFQGRIADSVPANDPAKANGGGNWLNRPRLVGDAGFDPE